MSQMFSEATRFNGDISNWDTSSLTSIQYCFETNFSVIYYHVRTMFEGATNFDGDLSNWDVSSVKEMRYEKWMNLKVTSSCF